MSRVVLRQRARHDLVDIVYNYIQRGSPASARRFRVKAEELFQRLAGMPNIGTRYDHDRPALDGVRFIQFPTPFRNFLVFYRTISDAIEIVRVLHAARDIRAVLFDEFGLEAIDEDGTVEDGPG